VGRLLCRHYFADSFAIHEYHGWLDSSWSDYPTGNESLQTHGVNRPSGEQEWA